MTREIAFFHVNNAFQNIEPWFNWTDSNNDPVFNAGVNQSLVLDIDGDSKKELIFFLSKTYAKEITDLPARSKVVILKFENNSLVDVTNNLILQSNSFPGIVSAPPQCADFNGDGIPDIVFPVDVDDGRFNARNGVLVEGSLCALVSNASGGYDAKLFGANAFWQHIAIGYDAMGVPFVFGSGSMQNVLEYPNYAFRYVEGSFVKTEGLLPNFDPMAVSLYGAKVNDYSNVMIAVNQFNMFQLDAYIKSNVGDWNWVGSLGYPFEKIGTVKYVSGEYNKIYTETDILYADGFYVQGQGGGGGSIGVSALIRLSPDEDFTLLGMYPINKLKSFQQDAVVAENDFVRAQKIFAADVKNGVLQWANVKIFGEITDYLGVSSINCLDVNFDGYDDIVLNRQLIGGVDNIAPIIYLNNHDHTFTVSAYLEGTNILPSGAFPLSSTIVGDLNSDGYQDIVMYLSNPVPDGLPGADFFKFYSGEPTAKLWNNPNKLSSSTNLKSAIDLTDVLDCLKLYLGKAIIDPSPYRILAADFDGNGVLNLSDVLSILKIYLGKQISKNPEWIFVNSELINSNATQIKPGSCAIDLISYNSIETSGIDIVGVLRGDVDGSWTG